MLSAKHHVAVYQVGVDTLRPWAKGQAIFLQVAEIAFITVGDHRERQQHDHPDPAAVCARTAPHHSLHELSETDANEPGGTGVGCLRRK